MSRWFLQGFVQYIERHLFLPGGLVGEGQEKEGVARYIPLALRKPFQRGPGALQARLGLPGEVLEVAPRDRHQRTQDPGLPAVRLTRTASIAC